MATLLVSSAGDNSDGLTWATAFNEISTAFDNLTGVQDDTVILDDEDHNQTGNLYTDGGTKTGGTLILESRSGDHRICSISGDPTGTGNFYLLRNNEITTGNPNLKVKNITFKDHSRTDSVPLIANTNTSIFTLENCACHNLNLTAAAAATNGLIRQTGTTSKDFTIAGLSVTNCSVIHINSTSSNEGLLFSSSVIGASVGTFSDIVVDDFYYESGTNAQMNGMCFYKGAQTWSGTNTFKNITIIIGENSYGLIKIDTTTGYNHSITGTMTIDNVNTSIFTSNTSLGLVDRKSVV